MRAFVICSVALISLAACDAGKQPKEPDSNTAAKLAAPPPLKAWDEFRFGMSFDEAITAAAGIEWDGDSFRKCRDQIPVKGCTLSPDAERSYRSSIAGMELLPSLNFNEDAQLTDVYLSRVYHAGVTAKQCEAMHARLLDQLTGQFGPARFGDEKGTLARRSPGGNVYHRSPGREGIMVAGIESFRTASDGSDIALLTTYTAGSEYSEPGCYVGFYVDGPTALRRRPQEKAEIPKVAESSSDEPSNETAVDEISD